MATGRSGGRSRTRSRGVWYLCTSRNPQWIVEPRPALAALFRTSGPPEPCEIGAMTPDVKGFVRSPRNCHESLTGAGFAEGPPVMVGEGFTRGRRERADPGIREVLRPPGAMSR